MPLLNNGGAAAPHVPQAAGPPHGMEALEGLTAQGIWRDPRVGSWGRREPWTPGAREALAAVSGRRTSSRSLPKGGNVDPMDLGRKDPSRDPFFFGGSPSWRSLAIVVAIVNLGLMISLGGLSSNGSNHQRGNDRMTILL